jgi:hypothetical protein
MDMKDTVAVYGGQLKQLRDTLAEFGDLGDELAVTVDTTDDDDAEFMRLYNVVESSLRKMIEMAHNPVD